MAPSDLSFFSAPLKQVLCFINFFHFYFTEAYDYQVKERWVFAMIVIFSLAWYRIEEGLMHQHVICDSLGYRINNISPSSSHRIASMPINATASLFAYACEAIDKLFSSHLNRFIHRTNQYFAFAKMEHTFCWWVAGDGRRDTRLHLVKFGEILLKLSLISVITSTGY